MKKAILLFGILSSCWLFGQIEIDTTPNPEEIGGTYEMRTYKKENIYSICFQNQKYESIEDKKCFSFINENNDFEKLYDIIVKGFEEMPKEHIKINLPNEKSLRLSYISVLGERSVRFILIENSILSYSRGLTKKEIERLFGKRKWK